MLHPFSYDLHIHSALSPCGDNDMTPGNIVGMSALKELSVIALTDHNSARNCPAAMKLGEQLGVLVIPGMELTTEEEVHVVCLFPDLDAALAFNDLTDERLRRIENKPEVFGHQYIMNENDVITGEITNLLINATTIGFDEVPSVLAPFGGIMIPAHLDKSTTSLISNLGFVPESSTFTTFECKKLSNLHALRNDHPYLRSCRVITDSDAHYLQDINEAVNFLELEELSIANVLRYIAGKDDATRLGS